MNWFGKRTLMLMAAIAFAAPASAKIVVGQPAPKFSFRQIDGQKVSLESLKGQVIVLNLWATWCGPCREEMPTLDALQQNGGKYGLRIFGILANDRTPGSALKKVQGVLHYPLSTSISGGYLPINNAVPTNYIIDRKGVVRYAKSGGLTQDSFAELIVPLLNESAE